MRLLSFLFVLFLVGCGSSSSTSTSGTETDVDTGGACEDVSGDYSLKKVLDYQDCYDEGVIDADLDGVTNITTTYTLYQEGCSVVLQSDTGGEESGTLSDSTAEFHDNVSYGKYNYSYSYSVTFGNRVSGSGTATITNSENDTSCEASLTVSGTKQ